MASANSRSPILKSSREAHSVRVENIAGTVTKREIVALFETLIGEVSSSKELQDGHVEITLLNQAAFKKALCMSGYTVGGKALIVSASAQSSLDDTKKENKRVDGRRNLYVLGLPFSLTKAEFTSIFSRYGTVSHCVILATVDNASRRRGFVVMSSHDEARAAMTGLARTQIKGNTLDISWAVVQRSQGFLDGGDRTVNPEPHPFTRERDNMEPNSANSSDTSIGSNDFELSGRLLTSRSSTSTLLITNLPALLFSQMVDLHPLLCPFGSIQKLEILPMVSHARGKTSVLVEYASVSNAKEAKETLQGQVYADCMVRAEYVMSSTSATALKASSSVENYLYNDNSPDLNPFARPFLADLQPLSQSQCQSHVFYEPASSYYGYDTRTLQNYNTSTSDADGAFFPRELQPRYAIPSSTNMPYYAHAHVQHDIRQRQVYAAPRSSRWPTQPEVNHRQELSRASAGLYAYSSQTQFVVNAARHPSHSHSAFRHA